ncbi:hypothetical protein PVAP13_7NG196270 [Panicum virgatum]|uniref:Uncharacterized protein n=1 Tax=Panicum virgatum TaxID=38727 RepID=A0A8T0PZL3_PANVG|nr:hypothetical protein PVAP13_7NG196270 [Panicum virgatum]
MVTAPQSPLPKLHLPPPSSRPGNLLRRPRAACSPPLPPPAAPTRLTARRPPLAHAPPPPPACTRCTTPTPCRCLRWPARPGLTRRPPRLSRPARLSSSAGPHAPRKPPRLNRPTRRTWAPAPAAASAPCGPLPATPAPHLPGLTAAPPKWKPRQRICPQGYRIRLPGRRI